MRSGEWLVGNVKGTTRWLRDADELAIRIINQGRGIARRILHRSHEAIEGAARYEFLKDAARRVIAIELKSGRGLDESVSNLLRRLPNSWCCLDKGILRSIRIDEDELTPSRSIRRSRGQLPLPGMPPIVGHTKKTCPTHSSRIAIAAPAHRDATHRSPEGQVINALIFIAGIGNNRISLSRIGVGWVGFCRIIGCRIRISGSCTTTLITISTG